ncbi:hypothetical protein [Moraxella oblonga]|uniref:hypothetical protein n=1 Tax=Moraxella oblonga TaxID=200413 RepID=UPI0008351FE0|nr:hypothetical protein [Moraxella oblonga]
MYYNARQILTTFALALLGANLCACAKPTEQTTQHQAVRENFYELTELDLSKVGFAKQIALTDNTDILIINDKGELWQIPHPDRPAKLAEGMSDMVAPVAKFDKIAFANKDGYFTLIQNGQIHRSTVRLSPHSAMLMLPFATIAVEIHDDGTASLVRLEVVGDEVRAVARFHPVLPDARPVQINFTGDNTNGHIAILSHPDSTTYQHGVLGDDIEAGQIQFLERHSLTPLAKPLAVKGLVFEANTVQILPHQHGNHLVGTMSGNGQGAKVVVIDNIDNHLKIIAQSTPLPQHRWQSPFVFDDKLYAVQMPHLVGRLVKYTQMGDKLTETALGEGYSNHAIGRFETNLVTSHQGFAIIPHKGYRNVSLLTFDNKPIPIDKTLPSPIVHTVSNDVFGCFLLADGSVWKIDLSK